MPAAVVGGGEEEVDGGEGGPLARRGEGADAVRRAEDLAVVAALGMRLEGESLNEGQGPRVHQDASCELLSIVRK
jgi:hypothetical protein